MSEQLEDVSIIRAGRTVAGTFAPGNKVASGNPLNRKAQKLRAALLRSVNKADVQRIIRALVERAAGGDVSAAALLFDRLMGKPKQAVEVSGPDGESIDVAARVTDLAECLKYHEAWLGKTSP